MVYVFFKLNMSKRIHNLQYFHRFNDVKIPWINTFTNKKKMKPTTPIDQPKVETPINENKKWNFSFNWKLSYDPYRIHPIIWLTFGILIGLLFQLTITETTTTTITHIIK